MTLLALLIASCSAVPPQIGSAGASNAPSLGLDGRYGWLVATRPDQVSSLVLVDEAGQTLSDPIQGASAAMTSPNGRFVALWVASPQGSSELRFLDTVLRPVAVGNAIFTTSEHLMDRGIVWANDSSAVAIATTPLTRTRENQSAPLPIAVRTIDRRSASVNLAMNKNLVNLNLLGWNRQTLTIAMSVRQQDATQGRSAAVQYATLDELGRGDLNVVPTSDVPVTVDGSARYVASVGPCTSGPGCRAVIVHDLVSYQAISESPLPPQGGWGVSFRPRSTDLLVQLERGSDMSGATSTLELWPDLGRGQMRELASLRVQANGAVLTEPGMLSRADGSAVSLLQRASDGTWNGDLVEVATHARTPISIRRPMAAVVLDGKLEAPPAVRSPEPTPLRYPVRTAEEVLRGVVTDPFVTGSSPCCPTAFDPTTLGTPIFVRALRATDRDEWLVPQLGGQGTTSPFISSVIVVSVDPDGLGAAGIKNGGTNSPPGLDVPPISEARAKSIASALINDVITANLVWMLVSPMQGFLCTEFYPMWRLMSRHGTVVYEASSYVT